MATTMDYAAYDRAYAAELHARFESRTPARVFDCHFHLSPNEMAPLPQSFTFDRCIKDTEAIIGKNRIKGGLLMGNPQMFETKEALDEERRYTCETVTKRDGFVAGLLVVPWDDPHEIEDWLRKYPKIVALKPYRCWSQVVDSFEADILEYAPEWMWELAEEQVCHRANLPRVHAKSAHRTLCAHPHQSCKFPYYISFAKLYCA